ncbi:U4/U6.U5 tri-snRNP-associated protein snu66 [Golovinomyces cichoracearum]|uniref:U4/U6.U5 tri-snRNP-associated protein snu66 n=1 Tax=Golovinomyces cichoracearum TaxID=62708 RepID=A0A420IWE1_9PEZI|nr:U4/U6.U5 tri-snRNP-associated protein snu66 [Golovinomyces cichoracearum]
MADAISIEETNRIRASLGMKPLMLPDKSKPIFREGPPTAPQSDEGSTLESRQAEGYENYRKLQEAELARKRRDAKSEAIKKARDAAKRFSKLEGKGLGESDGQDLDVKSWLTKHKKRQKQIEKARKMEKELAEAEMALEYTAKDLAGVKVGHELENFQEGEEQILTLKDATIDENEEEGDELENIDLRAKEKLDEDLKLKTKRPVYNPMEMDESNNHSILAHYDEEIDGKKRKLLTLDEQGKVVGDVTKDTSSLQNLAFNLDIPKENPESDYLAATEIKIKKPKKKKAKSIRQKQIDEEDIIPVPEESSSNALKNEDDQVVKWPVPKKRVFQDISFVDDDDLQRSLAVQRSNTLKKRQKLRPEAIAQQIREATQLNNDDDDIYEGQNTLIIDETSEFVANIQKLTGSERKYRSVSRQPEKNTSVSDDSDDDGDVKMKQSYAEVEYEDDKRAQILQQNPLNEEVTNNGLEPEETLDRGLGSTLKLLQGRGIIKTQGSEDLNAIYRQKQLFLAEKQRREAEAEFKARAQRERDRSNGRLDRMSAREKEEYARSQNTLRDQIESRQLAEHFNKEYKPNVELKYIDEFGRSMNKKEAFKHLSHQFHGKGSGKQKTEKILKKIEDEKRRLAQCSLDGSQIGGMSGATAQQRKKQGQAGVRLA